MHPSQRGLGRRTPKSFPHVERYPYEAVAPPTATKVEKTLVLPRWHWSHDQGRQGSCVGHGTAMERAISNTSQNRLLALLRPTRRYSALTIWNMAKLVDADPQTNPGDNNGTTVSAAYDVLRKQGAKRERKAYFDATTERVVEVGVGGLDPAEGVSEVRWAKTVDEIRTALSTHVPVAIGVDWFSGFDTPEKLTFSSGRSKEWWIHLRGSVRGGHCTCLYGASDERQAFRMKNSWGRDYPLVWLSYGDMEQLLARDGEAALVVDR